VTEKLIEFSHRINFTINKKKNQVPPNNNLMLTLKVSLYSFEQIDGFKYLGANKNTTNNIYNEIKLRINSSINKAYFSMYKMCSSRLLSKETLYNLFSMPDSNIQCETQETTHFYKENLTENSQTDLFKMIIPEGKTLGVGWSCLVSCQKSYKKHLNQKNTQNIKISTKRKASLKLVRLSEIGYLRNQKLKMIG
ncbi:Uncharacterized protein FWK35_00029654, partial [Aphis craccivora]